MKKMLFPLLCLLALLTSCKKDKDNNTPADNSMQVKLNGKALNFTVEGTPLLHTTISGYETLEIRAVSKDSSAKIKLIFQETIDDYDDGMEVKAYKIQKSNEDDPNTAADESEDSPEGFFYYGARVGIDTWMYQFYAQKGNITVTSCDTTAKKITGTFKVSLVNLNNRNEKVEFTEGRFTNVSYTAN